MKHLKRLTKLSLITALILSSIPTISLADCPTALKLCDKALSARDEEIRLDKLGIDVLKTQNDDLNKKVVELEGKSSAFYRNPWFLVALGVAVGAYAVRR